MYHVIANKEAYQDYKNTLTAILIIIQRSNTMEEALEELEELEHCLYSMYIQYSERADNNHAWYDESSYKIADTAYNADTVVDAIITCATDDYIQFPTDFIKDCFTPTFLC